MTTVFDVNPKRHADIVDHYCCEHGLYFSIIRHEHTSDCVFTQETFDQFKALLEKDYPNVCICYSYSEYDTEMVSLDGKFFILKSLDFSTDSDLTHFLLTWGEL